MISRRCALVVLWMIAAPIVATGQTSDAFPAPHDSETKGPMPIAAAEAAAAWKVPDGFRVSLFAGEPEVRQPIAMAFDARGRLWVAENYTYAEAGVNFDAKLRDRIVIFEDTDGDHRADRRTVFWDQAERLTSIEIGYGGVWALCTPHLLFIPDRDGDDRPDGAPTVMLDGWNVANIRHNVVNGLRWGPDGWLYGRHGILATSRVGTPETAESERTPLNCSIWRFHPTEKRFEVVCHGTTNPWGMDWNAEGELFFINTVIGHLWHVIPGAHYKRMYGEDFNPHLYELIDQTADHVHWDTANETWTATRTGFSSGTDAAGGGHAHSGLMIYQGSNWPAEYQNDVFAINFHGRRLNRDRLERDGATFTAHHLPDAMQTADPWFRGIDLAEGPDGGVYVLDWSDTGECHDEDGVHRSSGRIFKITYDQPGPLPGPLDIRSKNPLELAELTLKSDAWQTRQALCMLYERRASGEDMSGIDLLLLLHDVQRESAPCDPLQMLWVRNAIGHASGDELRGRLAHHNESYRAWCVRLIADRTIDKDDDRETLETLAIKETSGLVLTYLSSALQRLPLEKRWTLATALAQHDEFADDRVLPLMIWYGIEPSVPENAKAAAEFAVNAKMPKLARFTARRLASDLERNAQSLDPLVKRLQSLEDRVRQQQLLRGVSDALAGWRQAPAPAGWSEFAASQVGAEGELGNLVRELSAVFGDGRAIHSLRGMLTDSAQPLATRRDALRALVRARAENLSDALAPLLDDRDLAPDAVRGLAELDLVKYAPEMVSRFGRFSPAAREATIDVLITRHDTAAALMDAVAAGNIPREDVPVIALRQMQLLRDEALNVRIEQTWPETKLLAADKVEQLAALRGKLSAEHLGAADLAKGKLLYAEHCGKCHRLFGEGGAIGPELTGGQRGQLDYWLQNIIDPSATVGTNYRLSILELKDGRILNGIVGSQTDRTIVLQTATENVTLERSEIETIEASELSIMPEGQLNALNEEQIRDLMGYLMKP
jgi:putative membrane-bound dehydrogenase-like protein